MTPQERRNARLVATYGITLDEYNSILASQGGKCLICGREPGTNRPLVVDHNHETGVVRGLLCEQCNTGIGLLGDDIETMLNAVVYLKMRGDYGEGLKPMITLPSQSHPDLQEATPVPVPVPATASAVLNPDVKLTINPAALAPVPNLVGSPGAAYGVNPSSAVLDGLSYIMGSVWPWRR